MHIAMVTPYPAEKPRGGVEAAATNLVQQLAQMDGLRVTVLAPSYKGESHTERRDGFDLQWVPHPPLGFISYWSIFRTRVQRRLMRLKPDITHFQAMLALSNGYLAPYVGTVHGLGERDIRTRGGRFSGLRASIVAWAEGKARRALTNCIVINPYVAELLGTQLESAELHHISNPLDLAFFADVPKQQRKNDFLFVAKLDLNKNFGDAIKAFALAIDKLPSDARLIVYGPVADQDYQAECLELIEQSRLNERVVFVGPQPPTVIADHMRRARALVLTSRHEVAPMVISEALSCGLPTVTYRKCGMQYMIENGVTGVLVEDGEIQGIAQGLLTLVSSSGFEDRCLQASESYIPQRVALKTLQVYESALVKFKAQ